MQHRESGGPSPSSFSVSTIQVSLKVICVTQVIYCHGLASVVVRPSSLAKCFAHGPLSLHPWQIYLEFVISGDRHLAVFTGLAYKDDITFDQWVLKTVSCLGRCKMAAPSVAYT